ncbi:MAG: hypothetical protein Q8P67_24760, partial [archaeon]|nr:hypothetical protein [archaeon]
MALPSGFQGKRLYNLFRPEFALRYHEPLSPDSFTGFGIHDFRVHHPPVREATRYLREVCIPEFVTKLDKHDIIPIHGTALVALMHSHGINCRYLGVLRSRSSDERVKHLIATEMISRAANSIFREHMRNSLTQEELHGVVIQHLNWLLGDSDVSQIYWGLFIRMLLIGKFGNYNVDIWTPKETADLSAYVSKPALLAEIQTKTGIVLKQEAVNAADFSEERPFSQDDILEITSTVKRLITPHSLLQLLQQQGASDRALLSTLEDKLAANAYQRQV